MVGVIEESLNSFWLRLLTEVAILNLMYRVSCESLCHDCLDTRGCHVFETCRMTISSAGEAIRLRHSFEIPIHVALTLCTSLVGDCIMSKPAYNPFAHSASSEVRFKIPYRVPSVYGSYRDTNIQ